MDNPGPTRKTPLGPIATALILLCTVGGVAYGVVWGSPFGRISPPVILAFAVVVVVISLVVNRQQKKNSRSQSDPSRSSDA